MNPVLPSKPWYLSKTIWLAIITAASGLAISIATQYPGIGYFSTAVSVLSILNRLVTTLPIS